MRSSSICRTLIDEIEKAEKKKETEKLNADDLMKIETEQNGSEVKEGPSTSGKFAAATFVQTFHLRKKVG